MSEIPQITGREAVSAFEKAGFVLCRINGSHHIMKKDGCRFRLSIPVHAGKNVGQGLLAKQIKVAGLTLEQFKEFI